MAISSASISGPFATAKFVDEYHPKRLHKICVWARLRGSNFRTGLDQIQGGPFRYRRASSAGYSQGATSTNASGAFGRSPQACAPSRATGALVLGARGWEGRFQATPRQQRLGRCSRADDIGPHCQHSDVDVLTGGLTIALRAADSHRYDGSPGSIRCRSAVDFGERRRTDDQRQAIHLHSRSRTTRPEA